MANRTLGTASRKMFSFAVDQELVEHNPGGAASRGLAARSSPRDRVLSDDEIRTLWTVVRCAARPRWAAFYKLRLVTAQRGGEVASMRWQDVDLESALVDDPGGAQQEQARAPCARSPRPRSTLLKALQPGDGATSRGVYVLAGARGQAAADRSGGDVHGRGLPRARPAAHGGVA